MYTIVSRLISVVGLGLVSAVTVYVLTKSKRNIGSTTANRRFLAREFHFTVSLVSMNVIYVVMVTPLSVLALIATVNRYSAEVSADFVKFIDVVYSYTLYGPYLYEALHFFIYLAFNKMFRQEIVNTVLGRTVSMETKPAPHANGAQAWSFYFTPRRK